MNLYIQLDELEYEQFKKFKQHPNLEDHDVAELCPALLSAIKKERGIVSIRESEIPFDRNTTTTLAKIAKGNLTISLVIERS